METIGRAMQPFSAHHLMSLYICNKVQENISRVSELLSRHILKFTKGHNSITRRQMALERSPELRLAMKVMTSVE